MTKINLKSKYILPILGLIFSCLSTSGFSQSLPDGKAIIVLRHAQEQPPWEWLNERKAILPNGNEIKYHLKGLNTEGLKCSQALSTLLPGFIATKGLNPVSEVVAKDPRLPDPNTATPNPFDTILPFIQSQKIMSVKLNNDTSSVINGLDTSNNDSVIISYDRENLWGKSSDHTAQNNSIIYQINKIYGIDNNTVKGPPYKCIDMYVYTENKLTIYSLNKDFTKISEGKSDYCY